MDSRMLINVVNAIALGSLHRLIGVLVDFFFPLQGLLK